MREQIRIENILQFIEENSTIIVDNIDFSIAVERSEALGKLVRASFALPFL